MWNDSGLDCLVKFSALPDPFVCETKSRLETAGGVIVVYNKVPYSIPLLHDRVPLQA